ncbi:metallophosphoesterase family protein [Carboxylicivirga marina]|uniref:Metallophosphoesterase n=1 Tax=Carboxylicivirga marina TaxID=2800988 RepID=A0ABS1HQ53_9BACT|nr:metallophosphoesterase [Carboxylicivirga marina]MBK3519805.1 metallophosphoesterase [Carboxylicivirga marina]
MNPNQSRHALVAIFVVVLLFSSCKEIIEYSPYQNIVKSKWKKQNVSNYNKLLPEADEDFTPFRVGLISDSHSYYDEFEKQVKYINTRSDLDFIIHLGDVTLSANAREYDWYSDIMNNINVPVITIIGNHDCLGNGYDIYTEMFGESNFFFKYKDVKFVMFDDIIWEKKVTDPDFEWFDKALVNDSEYVHVIPFAHIPPWDEQFSLGNEFLYNQIILRNNLNLSIHGHGHSYGYSQPYDDVNYLSIPAPIRNELIILDIQSDTIKHELVRY